MRIRPEAFDSPRRRILAPLAALFACALLVVATPAVGQGSPEDTDLAATIEANYDVLPVQGDVILRPRDPEAAYQAVDFSPAGVAVDGELLDPEAVRERLGEAAEAVLALADMEPVERRELLLEPAAETEPPAAEEAPVGEAPPEPPEAPEEPAAPEPPRRFIGEKVVFGSSVTIEADEEAREVVVIGGGVTIEGYVQRDVVVIGGPARIDGTVNRGVVVVGGSLRLGPDARVERDIQVVGGKIERDPGAYVGGTESEISIFGPGFDRGDLREVIEDVEAHRHGFRPFRYAQRIFWSLIKLVIFALLIGLVYLLAQRPVGRIGDRIHAEPWKAAVVGLLAQVLFFPLLFVTVVVLCISVIGIPLLLLIPFALLAVAVAAFVGYAGSALAVGRLLDGRFGWGRDNPFLMVFLGVVSIQIWWVVATLLDVGPLDFLGGLIGFLAFLIVYAAWTVGFGALLLMLVEGRRAGRSGATPPPGPPQAPPPAAPGRPRPDASGHDHGTEPGAEPERPPSGGAGELPPAGSSSDGEE